MRKYLVPAVIALGLATVGLPAQAQMMGGYGGGGYGMMGGYGGGYGMGGGSGHGPGMTNGYGGGYGMGPGMMYGYGANGEPYDGRRGQGNHVYRGKQLCWHQTGDDQNSGYYGKCPN